MTPPVVPGRLYGLRRWRVDWGEQPLSMEVWGAGGRCRDDGQPTRAHCGEHRFPKHRAPHATCGCGLYGLHPRASAARELCGDAADDGVVIGIVEAWGQVELHRDGFRAEYARPHAFVVFRSVPDPAHEARTLALAKAHGVAVLRVDGASTLHRHCVEQGLGMSDETVRELVPPDELFPRVKPTAAPSRRRERRWHNVAEIVGGVVFCVIWLAIAGAIAVAAVGTAISFFEGEDSPVLTVGDNRHLHVLEQAVVPLDDGEAIYVARVTNTHPRRTALGVFARGRFVDSDGSDAGQPDARFEIEQRPTLAPGETGVVVDFIEAAHWADDVAGFETDFRARGFEVGARRAVATVGTVRLDTSRCLLTARVNSRKPLASLDVPVIGRDENGTIDGAGLFVAGPVPRGRSLQVLERIDPELCGDGLRRLEGYASARPGQLR